MVHKYIFIGLIIALLVTSGTPLLASEDQDKNKTTLTHLETPKNYFHQRRKERFYDFQSLVFLNNQYYQGGMDKRSIAAENIKRIEELKVDLQEVTSLNLLYNFKKIPGDLTWEKCIEEFDVLAYQSIKSPRRSDERASNVLRNRYEVTIKFLIAPDTDTDALSKLAQHIAIAVNDGALISRPNKRSLTVSKNWSILGHYNASPNMISLNYNAKDNKGRFDIFERSYIVERKPEQ